MDKVARLSPRDRSDLIRAAAAAKGVSVQLMEKDFWVCWVLRNLYDMEFSAPIYFKGGTSLSKAYGVVERMSEDIDLVIDRQALGFMGGRDPAATGLSGKRRDRLIAELKGKAARYVDEVLRPALAARFAEVLGAEIGWTLKADLSDLDNTVIDFVYPTIEQPSPYLKDRVILELGARGDAWPAVERTIRPYAADHFPGAFDRPECRVQVITAERTFWEKATYLHALAHQDSAKAAVARPARHYYDVYQLANHPLGRAALRDTELLADVVRHKMIFYKRAADRYDLAVPGTLRLVPDGPAARAIATEYRQMAEEMVFGEAPAFEVVLSRLREVEREFNGASSTEV